MTSSVLSDWLAQRLAGDGVSPIYRQLHGLLQQAILQHMLAPGSKLPSSRLLADELAIARNTVTNVYEQLALEGYVRTTRGGGTYVTDNTSDEIIGADERAGASTALPPAAESRGSPLSVRGQRLLSTAGASNRQWGAFMPGVPDVTAFPARVWSRL